MLSEPGEVEEEILQTMLAPSKIKVSGRQKVENLPCGMLHAAPPNPGPGLLFGPHSGHEPEFGS